jgi:hypothetical protein
MNENNVGDYKKFKDTHERDEEIKKGKITIFFTFTFFVFLLEFILKKPINSLSLLLLRNLNYDGRYCELLDYILSIQSHLGKVFLIIVIINFKTIFSGLIFVLMTEFMVFFCGFLKLMYIDPRPFWEEDLVPCSCMISYGNPSIFAAQTTVMYLTFYKIFTYKKGKITKNISLVVLYVFISVISIAGFLQNVNSLNQILFGICLSYSLYYLVFDVFELDTEAKYIFRIVIKKQRIIELILYLLGIYLIANLIHYSYEISHNHSEDYSEEWYTNILKYCTYIPYLFFDSASYHSVIFLPISILISIYLEYSIIFSKNYNKFICYNSDDKLSMKWNNTNIFLTLLRISVTFIVVYFINYFCNVGDINNDSFFKLIFFRYILMNSLIGLFIFFIGKLMYKYLGLTNNAVFNKKNEFFFMNYESICIDKIDEELINKYQEGRKNVNDEKEEENDYFNK